MSIRLYVELTAQEGKGDKVVELLGGIAPTVREKDQGCEGYELYRSTENPEKFYMIESWATQADLDAHGKAPHMAALAGLRDVLAGRSAMHRYED